MKKHLLRTAFLFIICNLSFEIGSAQYCGQSDSTICTPVGTLPVGVLSDYQNYPCIVKGVPFSEPVHVRNLTSFVQLGFTVTVDSLTIDTIANLPCGMCWATNKTGNTYAGGEDGCVLFSGTTNDQAGVYKLYIKVTAYTNFGVFHVNADDATIRFWLRVIDSVSAACVPIDTANHNTRTACATPPCVLQYPLEIITTGAAPSCGNAHPILSLTTSYPFAQYRWGNTEDFMTLFNPVTTPVYTDTFPLHIVLFVTDSAGCNGSIFSEYVGASGVVVPQEICLVTVDSATNGVLILWDKNPDLSNVDSFIIIRDVNSNIPVIVGKTSPNDLGEFLDTSIDASLMAYTYAIGIQDTCGTNTNTQGFYHTTIHLDVDSDQNGFARLTWTAYAGSNLNDIKIYHRLPGGVWTPYFLITDYSQQIIDWLVPYGLYEYKAEMLIDHSCTSSRSFTYNTTSSNRSRANSPTTSILPSNSLKGEPPRINPNPASSSVSISINESMVGSNLIVADITGRKMMTGVLSSVNSQWSLVNLSNGVYFVTIENEKGRMTKKLVVRK